LNIDRKHCETVAQVISFSLRNLVGTEGIEPNCRHSAYYGK
jgi:hypothetical protein